METIVEQGPCAKWIGNAFVHRECIPADNGALLRVALNASTAALQKKRNHKDLVEDRALARGSPQG